MSPTRSGWFFFLFVVEEGAYLMPAGLGYSASQSSQRGSTQQQQNKSISLCAFPPCGNQEDTKAGLELSPH